MDVEERIDKSKDIDCKRQDGEGSGPVQDRTIGDKWDTTLGTGVFQTGQDLER